MEDRRYIRYVYIYLSKDLGNRIRGIKIDTRYNNTYIYSVQEHLGKITYIPSNEEEREGINNTTYSTYSLEDLGKIVDGGGIHRERKRKKISSTEWAEISAERRCIDTHIRPAPAINNSAEAC